MHYIRDEKRLPCDPWRLILSGSLGTWTCALEICGRNLANANEFLTWSWPSWVLGRQDPNAFTTASE